MSTPTGSRKEHSCDKAVYPKVRVGGGSIKRKTPSTRGAGLPARKSPRKHR